MPKARKTIGAVKRAKRDGMIDAGVRAGHAVTRIATDLEAAGFVAPARSRLVALMRQAKEKAGASTPSKAKAQPAKPSVETEEKASAKPAGASAPSGDFLARELARLEELQQALHAKALAGDNAAADRVLAILDRRAKLLGVAIQPPAPPEAGGGDAKEILRQKLDAMAARLSRAPSSGDVAK